MVGIFAHIQLFVNLLAERIQRVEFYPLHPSSSKEQEMKSVNVSCHNSFLPLPDLLCQIKHFIYLSSEQNLRPLPSLKNQKDNGRNVMRHTQYGFTAFVALQSGLQKTQSYSAKDLCQANGNAERPWQFVRAHCLRIVVNDTQSQVGTCETGIRVTSGKAVYANDVW